MKYPKTAILSAYREITMLSEDEIDDLVADTNFQHGRDYERERIIAIVHTFHIEAHISTPSGVCKPCRMIAAIDNE